MLTSNIEWFPVKSWAVYKGMIEIYGVPALLWQQSLEKGATGPAKPLELTVFCDLPNRAHVELF